jgi:phage baseplate assembly protein gpV
MDSIVGVMKKVAQQEAQKIYTTELGIVTAIFPHGAENDKDNYQCSVILKNKKQPDGTDFELRKVPIATPHLGWTNIPQVDDLVLVTFIAGNINAPVIIGRLYNDAERPPINKEKEFLLQHPLKDGSQIRIDQDSVVTVTSKDKKSILTVKDKEITSTNEKCEITLNDGDMTFKNQQCNISLKGTILTIDNGTCKIEIAGGGITIDAASSNLTLKSLGGIKIGDAATSTVELGGRVPGNAIADNDDILLTTHTHLGNLGAPCPILIPTEKINSIQAKARNTKVG